MISMPDCAGCGTIGDTVLRIQMYHVSRKGGDESSRPRLGKTCCGLLSSQAGTVAEKRSQSWRRKFAVGKTQSKPRGSTAFCRCCIQNFQRMNRPFRQMH